MPRLYLEHFRRGILRSYKYQLLDDRTEEETRTKYRGQAVQEAHFGFIDYDLQPKLSYYAVKNLITILQDDAAATAPAQPESLTYSLTGPEELRHVLLQKSNGDLYLAVWRAVAIWDPEERREISVEPVQVTVKFEREFPTVRVYRPTESSQHSETYNNVSELPLSLAGQALILELVAE